LLEEKWRSRNILVQGDEAYSYGWSSGQMFTDPVSYLLPTSSVPYWYLESPSFNFTGYSNLALSFNMMVIASSGSGGNFQFSTNGGNTWSVLQPTVASQAYNWHNSLPLLSMLFNEPGWTTFVKPVTYLDSAWFDLSFLTGQPNVVFRFQFRSNASPSGPGYPQGMRIDNFRISGTPVATSVPTNKVGYFDLYTYNDKVYANYDVSNDRTNQYTLSLVNMLGQICASSSVELVKGGNAFQLPSHLANGVYLVTLSNGDNIVQKKVTLLRN
ncbi:MAG: T9SS type A sorting domain-containing protein, partial [Bacteroidia bacterium]